MIAFQSSRARPSIDKPRRAPLFSVIIPTHNRGQLLRQTLASVLSQREADFEVIVVDDGSTDETPQVLAEYASRVTVITQQNAGPGAARNRGVAEARGDYVAFLDSDDLWFPWTLTTIRMAIERCAPVSLITSCPCEFTSPTELDAIVHEEPRFERFNDFFAACDRFRFVGSGTMVVARDAFLRVGGFTSNVRVAEDLDLVLRLGVEPGYVYIAAPPLLAYRRHDESLVSNLDQTLQGIDFLISQERSGRYPGGRARRVERQKALSRFTRSASLAALRGRQVRRGLSLYRRTLAWNFSHGRARYLAGFPLLAAVALGRSAQRS